MQIANIPLKFYVPFAQNDSSRVEIPITTTDATRASQSLGFPPLTMQPPESGGVPPQGEDFNGAMNQIARIAWWLMAGGPFIYDATFSSNSNINGYPQGARVATSDYLGAWLSTVDNNQNNPDTTGTNWVPGYSYGQTTVALSNTNVTLTPLQATKRTLVFTGTLTGNVVVTVPAWVYAWTVINSTTGAFTVTVTTAGGSGAVVPQGGSTALRGDGTNVNFDIPNTPTAPQFSSGQQSVNAAFVKQALGSFSSVITANANVTLSLTAIGAFVECTGSTAFTITLPSTATVPAGSSITFVNNNSTTVTLSAQTGNIVFPGQSAASTYALLTGCEVEITFDGTNWLITALSGFVSNLLAQGFQWLPSGLLLQWSTIATSSSSYTTWTFPIAFPTVCLQAWACPQVSSLVSTIGVVNLGAATRTTVPVASINAGSSPSYAGATLSVLALGH